jgi:NAD(P)-dependent dehydrogenase (short-subunit alcohol dehydrogenase family)
MWGRQPDDRQLKAGVTSMSGVNGKVVAITRASSGIDEATALELAARGAAVVLGIRHADRLNTGRTNPRLGRPA